MKKLLRVLLFCSIVFAMSRCFIAFAEKGTVPMNSYNDLFTCAVDPVEKQYYFAINEDISLKNILTGYTAVYGWKENEAFNCLFRTHSLVRQIIAYDGLVFYIQDTPFTDQKTLVAGYMKIVCYDTKTKIHTVIYRGLRGYLHAVDGDSLFFTSGDSMYQYRLKEHTIKELFSAERFYECEDGIIYTNDDVLYCASYDGTDTFILDSSWTKDKYISAYDSSCAYYSKGILEPIVIIDGVYSMEVPTHVCSMSSSYIVWVDLRKQDATISYLNREEIGNEEAISTLTASVRSSPIVIGDHLFFLSELRQLPITCVNLSNGTTQTLK